MAKISILEALRLALAANKEYIDSKYYDIDAIDELLNGKADVDHEIHLVLGEENTNAFYGDKGKVAYDHSQADHAPIDAQKNSDITKEEIEAKLTGEITSHTHNQYITADNIENFLGDALLKTEQSLTDAEKDQVRDNLGFIGKTATVGETVTVDGKTYTVEPNAEIFGDYDTNKAIGSWSIAEGSENVAVGRASHVEGAMNKAIGTGTHVEGVQCKATGYWSHAEGERTIVSSYASHAEGSYTNLPDGSVSYGTASGYASHVEGGGCHATGSCSHAQGLGTRANGFYSDASGAFTVASGQAQSAIGRCNIEDTENKYIQIAGNGSWDQGKKNPTRSNAYTLDWNGNGWFAGNLSIGEDNKQLATEDFVESLNVTISDGKVVLKNGNGETLSEANLEIANSDDIDAILASLDEDKEEN